MRRGLVYTVSAVVEGEFVFVFFFFKDAATTEIYTE